MTERLLMGCKETNQTKQTSSTHDKNSGEQSMAQGSSYIIEQRRLKRACAQALTHKSL